MLLLISKVWLSASRAIGNDSCCSSTQLTSAALLFLHFFTLFLCIKPEFFCYQFVAPLLPYYITHTSQRRERSLTASIGASAALRLLLLLIYLYSLKTFFCRFLYALEMTAHNVDNLNHPHPLLPMAALSLTECGCTYICITPLAVKPFRSEGPAIFSPFNTLASFFIAIFRLFIHLPHFGYILFRQLFSARLHSLLTLYNQSWIL